MARLSPKAQQILVRAAELLRIPGAWRQGSLFGHTRGGYTDTSSYCMLGAIRRAEADVSNIQYKDGRKWQPEALEVRDAVHRRLPNPSYTHIPSFNDADSTTLKDVMNVMCQTIKEEVTDDAAQQDSPETPPESR